MVKFETSKPYAGDLSNYTISFETIIQVNVYEECFVKYLFPSTLGVQELDLS
jgi:hypothetical protein